MSTTVPEPTTVPELTISGFCRADGRVGVRNHLVVISTSVLTNRLASLAERYVPGATAITSDAARAEDDGLSRRVLDGIVHHPNVAAVLLLTHERESAKALQARYDQLAKPIHVLALLTLGGMADAVEVVLSTARSLASASVASPETVELADLVVAVECSGSDVTTSNGSNIVIGRLADRLVDAGGTVLISETLEFMGAEALIEERAATPEVARRIIASIAAHEVSEKASGLTRELSERERAMGFSTLVERSLGRIVKAGTSRFEGALDYAEPVTRPGLWFMDTPVLSPMSVSGMVLGGAVITLVAIGTFDPTGSPLAPTLRISANPVTCRNWRDAIDVDAGGLFQGIDDFTGLEEECLRRMAAFARGERCAAERWGDGEILCPPLAHAG